MAVSTDFIIGENRFEDLQINPTPVENFYYFYDKSRQRLIKQFVLIEKTQVRHLCRVTLIKKGEKFTPRLQFSVRDKLGQIQSASTTQHDLRASIDLGECQQSFWQLVSFLRSLSEIEIPRRSFSLISRQESEIVAALQARSAESLIRIIKQLSSTAGVLLSEDDVNQLLKRKDRLVEFKEALQSQKLEKWWQVFFEDNKWIFGYALDYRILRQEQVQPHYGGVSVQGRGGRRGDYLTSTIGDIKFIVLVEIKTPKTKLLQGMQEIRTGAWSLSKELGDAIAQIQANISTWDKRGSEQPENRDRFDNQGIYTVEPKGIVVIGSLQEVKGTRNKWETFQRFRQSIHGIDIITFDELYSRARFIVEHKE